MKYDIFYRPVFAKKDRKLAGYDMVVYPHDPLRPTEDFDVLSVETDSPDEFTRFENMLSGEYDPFSDVAFVDKHPIDILRYLRGEKEKLQRTPNWEDMIGDWSVNLRGERV